jgi:hypothetical protein
MNIIYRKNIRCKVPYQNRYTTYTEVSLYVDGKEVVAGRPLLQLKTVRGFINDCIEKGLLNGSYKIINLQSETKFHGNI